MEAMRESWTDARLDDLNHRVDESSQRMDNGFNRVDADIRALRTEMNSRFDALQRTILQLGGGAIVTIAVGFASLIATGG